MGAVLLPDSQMENSFHFSINFEMTPALDCLYVGVLFCDGEHFFLSSQVCTSLRSVCPAKFPRCVNLRSSQPQWVLIVLGTTLYFDKFPSLLISLSNITKFNKASISEGVSSGVKTCSNIQGGENKISTKSDLSHSESNLWKSDVRQFISSYFNTRWNGKMFLVLYNSCCMRKHNWIETQLRLHEILPKRWFL